jgi:hypothetical protein
MKKMSLLTFTLVASLVGFAQDTTMNATTPIGSLPFAPPELRTSMAVKTRFGLKAGVNLAKLSAKEFEATADPSTNNKTSYCIGAFANIPLGAMFRLQPELVYSSQGSNMEESSTIPSTNQRYNYEEDLDYLNIPVMFQLQTTSGFFVETGPQFGFITSAITKGTTPISTTDKTDIKDFRDRFDIAWGLGVGYLSRIGLGVNARYNYGIRNIVHENNMNIGELRNQVLQFGLVYQFGAYK